MAGHDEYPDWCNDGVVPNHQEDEYIPNDSNIGIWQKQLSDFVGETISIDDKCFWIGVVIVASTY